MAREYFKNLPNTTTPLRAERINGLLNGEESIEKIVAGSIEGKNLFDETTATNITISATGAIASNNSYKTSDYITIIPSQSYCFFTTQRSGQTTKQIYLAYYDSSKTFISRDNYNLYENSFITPSNAKYVRAGYYSDGQEKPQLEIGSTATDYVPYMKYGYNSQESMGNIVVDDVSCKNLFDKNNINVLNAYFSTTVTTITSNDVNKTIYIKCDANKTYTISKLLSSVFNIGYTTTLPAIGTTVNGIMNSTTGTYDGNTRVSGTITTGNNAQYLVVRAVHTSNDGANSTNIMNSIKIEEGSQATSYTPFKSFDATAYVLWQNPSPTSNFAGQQITLNDSLVNYKYYEIISFYDINNSLVITSGKIPYNKQAFLNVASFKNCRRLITANGLTTLTFGDGQTYSTYNSTTATVTNDNLIPYQVIAYK